MKHAATLVTLALLLTGCDEAQVREGARQFSSFDQDAVRILVSPDGIGRLVDVANPDGFPLAADAQPLAGALDVSIGPLQQTLVVATQQTTPGNDTLQLSTRFDQPEIGVPLKVRENGTVRICRWKFTASRISVTAEVGLNGGPDGRVFEVQGTPAVTLEAASEAPIDDCGLPDEGPTSAEALGSAVETFVTDAFAASAGKALPQSPLDVLEPIRNDMQISRLSTFENRRGLLVLEGNSSDGVSIDGNGLAVSVAETADAQRAPCAPPLSIQPASSSGARPLDPDGLRRFGADLGVAISSTWLSRVAQAFVLAGFACRGLEDARPAGTNQELIPVDNLLLGELGIHGLPAGPYATLVLSPGSLPDVRLQPDNGTVSARWANLEIDVYVTLFGARTRVAQVVSDVEFDLRPRTNSVDEVRFDVESITVDNRSVVSDFVAAANVPDSDTVDRWIRRSLLLMLQDRFAFPLPIQPVSSVRVVGAQVRTTDLVTYLRFDG